MAEHEKHDPPRKPEVPDPHGPPVTTQDEPATPGPSAGSGNASGGGQGGGSGSGGGG